MTADRAGEENRLQPDVANVDYCTIATTTIQAYRSHQILGSATGFFWSSGEAAYLVTNWHNVTGRDPVTGQHTPHGGEPNNLHFDIVEGRNLKRRSRAWVSLYDANGHPVWLEHPRWRSAVDVVCLPIPHAAAHVHPLNEGSMIEAARLVGQDVFVLGFPRTIGPNRLAIWKRASIASEPEIEVDGLPLTLIDTATSKGMSGGPVIQRFRGDAILPGQIIRQDADGFQLLGVYSGRRIGPADDSVVLGQVWKARLIDEIIAGATRGSIEPRGDATPPAPPMDPFSLPPQGLQFGRAGDDTVDQMSPT